MKIKESNHLRGKILEQSDWKSSEGSITCEENLKQRLHQPIANSVGPAEIKRSTQLQQNVT